MLLSRLYVLVSMVDQDHAMLRYMVTLSCCSLGCTYYSIYGRPGPSYVEIHGNLVMLLSRLYVLVSMVDQDPAMLRYMVTLSCCSLGCTY